MRRIAVFYDLGATPVDILTSLDGIAEPVFVLSDSAHSTGLREMIAEVAEVREPGDLAGADVAGVVTFSDFQLEAASVAAEQLGLPFHPVEVARDLTRKYRQRTLLNAAGVSPTPTALVTDLDSAEAAADLVPMPAVLKPNRGVGGTDTYPVGDRAKLLALAATLVGEPVTPDDGYVLEAWLRPAAVPAPWGGFVSVESLVRGGEVTHLGITGKFSLTEPFRERGGYLPVRPGSVDEPAVLDLATRALQELKVGDSICHTEVMLTADRPCVIEVNGRVGGHVQDVFLRAHNLNLITLAARIALGDPVFAEPKPCDRVIYQYMGIAPMWATELTTIPNVAEVRASSQVERFELMIRPGSALDWRRGFRDRVYSCRGTTDDHADLADFVMSLDDRLGIRYG